MPHMAPISWTLILIMSLTLIVVLSAMVYFSVNPLSPSALKDDLLVSKLNWKW